MISRYALYETAMLYDRFNLDKGLPKGVRPRYNVHPTLDAPVVVSREGKAAVELMRWGLMAKDSKDLNSVFRYKTYNIPSEKILSKHSWEMAVRQSRCLVPVNGFYLLGEDSGRERAYYVRLKDPSLFALAGIYNNWHDPQGTLRGTYSVITVESGRETVPNSNRLPVIVRRDEESRWLDPSVSDANSLYDMLRPYSPDLLHINEVGLGIFTTKTDQPDLITAIE